MRFFSRFVLWLSSTILNLGWFGYVTKEWPHHLGPIGIFFYDTGGIALCAGFAGLLLFMATEPDDDYRYW